MAGAGIVSLEAYMKKMLAIASMGLALSAPTPLEAAASDEMVRLRREVEQMKQEYQQRIKELEERLQRAEATVQQAQASAAKAEVAAQEVATAPPPPIAPAAAPSALNPAISVILDGSYRWLSEDPSTFVIPGFALGEEVGPGERGLSLGESELNISANVDDWFFGNLTAAIAPEGGIEVEEAYFQTLSLPRGFLFRGGRFFSHIGYLNEVHAHAWDFIDQPLPYQAMLDNQFGDDGVQLRWVAPTALFLELGGELFRGDSFPAGGANDNGVGTRSAFLHVGGDVGESHAWQAGVSQLWITAQDRETGEGDLFTGDSNLTILDFVWKWAPGGNPSRVNLKLSGEYFSGNVDGRFNDIPYDGNQDGWYLQGVYQFMPGWRVGYRYDQVHADDVGPELAGTVLDNQGHTPRRNSLMVDYSRSEFSRLRLQYTRDESRPDVIDHQWFLQYIMSLGPHGAHRF
jgi:hypothetical protein